jgi:choline monooxygenase
VNPSSFEFDDRLEFASTLPSSWYTDADILSSEKTKVFGRTWQLVGRSEQVAGAGQYFTTTIGDEPVIVARGADMKLRAFSNVCRHRAGPVASGEGCRKSFQCGYHGWTYALDGRLTGTPEFDGVQCWNKDEQRLPEYKVESWGALVFVNLDPDAAPLAETLEDLPQRLGAREDWGEMRLAERKDWYLNCNWKVYVDNYLEGYHIPIVHPSLHQELDYAKYRTETRRLYSIQHAPLRQSGGARIRTGDASSEDAVMFFWIFPNLMLNVYADNYSTNLIVPIDAERTLTVFEWHFKNPELPDQIEKIRRTIEFSDEIQLEDIKICESVQRGLRSRTYDRGRYSVRRENGVHHFHRLLVEYLKAE